MEKSILTDLQIVSHLTLSQEELNWITCGDWGIFFFTWDKHTNSDSAGLSNTILSTFCVGLADLSY